MNKIRIVIVLLILGIIISFMISGRSACIRGGKSKTKTGSSGNTEWAGIAAPSNLSGTAVSYSQIDLSFQDNSNNEDGFEIYLSIDGITYTLRATVGAGTVSYSDPGPFLPFVTYYYRVRAFNTGGDVSTWSNVASAITIRSEWQAMAAGDSHSLALNTNNTLWVWGNNQSGQLGLGDYSPNTVTIPTLLGSDTDWSAIATGAWHTFAIKTDKTLWAWGANDSGQLGLGTSDDYRTEPTPVGTTSDWVLIAGGANHTIGLKTNGTIWSWGRNYTGQLGLGDSGDGLERTTPTQIGIALDWLVMTGTNLSTIEAGSASGFALKTNRTLWAWGWNTSSSLGLGDVKDRNTPSQTGNNTSDWLTITAGYWHTIALKTNGTLWGCGKGYTLTLEPIGVEADWTMVTAGGNDVNDAYTIAIKSNRTLWAWGEANLYGQLGLGYTGYYINIPTQVGSASAWLSVIAGGFHTVGLTTDGRLWVWGLNNSGQLGLGDTVDRNIPCPLGSPTPPTALTTTIISSSQIDLSWTDISINETGFMIERKTEITGTWTTIATVGFGITSYSDTGLTVGTVYYYRIRAYNNFGDSPYSNEEVGLITSTLIAPTALNVRVISSSQIDLFWNDNSLDETGFKIERKIGAAGTYSEIATTATNVNSYSDTTVVLPGNTYYYRVRAYNALTNSEYSEEVTPSLATPFLLTLVVISSTQINLSWSYDPSEEEETGFKIERKIGRNGTYEQIGTTNADITTYSDITPAGFTSYIYYRVKAYNPFIESAYSNDAYTTFSGDWSIVVRGASHSIALRTNTTLWTWGNNESGKLGLGDATNRSTPSSVGTQTDWLVVSRTLSAVAGGGTHTLALKTTGRLWSWGKNDSGQLGLGDITNRTTPSPVGTQTNWSAVAAGHNHTIALKTDSTLWTWGYNWFGQLGLGNSGNGTERNTPTAVGTQSDWSAASAGYGHTLTLKRDGTLWTWGLNNESQLGLGDATNRKTPSRVGTQSDWSTVTAGWYHTVGLKTDRTLWTWGYNTFSQLGFGDATNRKTPSRLGTQTDWSAVAAGGYHTLALKTTGTLWSWGKNDSGQLGLGDITNRTTPSPVGTQTDWSVVAAGEYYTLAIKTAGTLWAWGQNGSGQLGLGDTTDRNTPTLVGE